MFVVALALSVLVTSVDCKTTKEETLQAHIETLRELVKAQAQRIEELEASESHRRSLGSYDGKDCMDIYTKNPSAKDGVYTIKPDGIDKPFKARCLMSSPAGVGWTKIMYFPSARKLTSSAVGDVTASRTSTGKFSDEVINALMNGDKEMLAVMPNDANNWIKVKWGAEWVFKDTRKSGEPGGFCQDTKGIISGPQITDSCGWDDPATYKDKGNAASSYCWADHGKGAKKWHGIDLQNDGNGQSNAQNCKGGQVPHIMYVRTKAKTEWVAGPNGQICDTVCKNIGTKCIPYRVPVSKGLVEEAFKEAGVYEGQGCKVTDMRSGTHSKLSIWYRTVAKTDSIYGKCYAYAGAMTHCTDHGSTNNDGNLCMCIKRQPKDKPDGKDCMDIYVKNPAAKDGVYTIKPDGVDKPFLAQCLMQSPAGAGWTKIMYFPNPRKLTAEEIGDVAQSKQSVGKFSDKVINALMSGDKEMLAVMPQDANNWIKVKWGAKWVFKDTRKSGEPGGFCQDTKGTISGPQITDSCGWDDPATYKDKGNAASSYCWADHGKGAKKWHGIDLQNDGNGQSNAQNCKGGQVPHIMYVRSAVNTKYVAGANGQICNTVCKNIGAQCIPYRVPKSQGEIQAAFKSAGVYEGQGCKVMDMRQGSHDKLSIWYRTVDKSNSVYGKCYAYPGMMTHCTNHGSTNSDGNLCLCGIPVAKPIVKGTYLAGPENTSCETVCKTQGRKCLPFEVPETEVDLRAMFKDAGVYDGKGCTSVEIRTKDDKAATFPAIWYRTVDKSSSVYGKCYAYVGKTTDCKAHKNPNNDGNLCKCAPKPPPPPPVPEGVPKDLSSYTGVRIAKDKSVLTLGANQDIVLVRTDDRTAVFLGNIKFQDGDVKTLKDEVKLLKERLNKIDNGGKDIKVGG